LRILRRLWRSGPVFGLSEHLRDRGQDPRAALIAAKTIKNVYFKQ
jgi:hypothetical protein